MTLPRIIAEDWPRKLTALFFAVLIWLSVNSQLQDHVILQDVPVVLEYDPNSVIPESDVFTVDVKVRGQGSALRSLQTGDINIRASIGPVTRDMPFYSVPLSPDNASSPFGTKVVEIIPDRIQVGIDRIVRRRNIPVVPRFKGTLKKGYSRARTKVFPKTVSISGPSKIAEDVEEVTTEPIPLDETLDADFETDVRLARIPKVTIGTESVHVAVELTRNSIERPFSDLPLHLLLPPNADLRAASPPPPVSVTLRGPQIVLDELDLTAIRAFADVSSITNPGRYRCPVQVWVAAGGNVTSETVFPPMVEIELVQAKPEEDRQDEAPADDGRDAPQPDAPEGEDAQPQPAVPADAPEADGEPREETPGAESREPAGPPANDEPAPQ